MTSSSILLCWHCGQLRNLIIVLFLINIYLLTLILKNVFLAYCRDTEIPGMDSMFHSAPSRYFQGAGRSQSPFSRFSFCVNILYKTFSSSVIDDTEIVIFCTSTTPITFIYTELQHAYLPILKLHPQKMLFLHLSWPFLML